jgi:cytochrome b pre-mRNA-processing protein 3
MIFPLFRRSQGPATISALYGMIVAQARSPVFYREYGVSDTVDGRFELLLLHVVLVLRRLGTGSEREVGQQVFDLFCQDMDRNLREMGIGDLKVPAEMRRIGEAYYGRSKAYEAALASGDEGALNAVIARNVFGAPEHEPPGAARFGTYIKRALDELAGQDAADLQRGHVSFPQP